ncbi:unnamed protein product [Urochloa decumbens]|uniref:GTD-binding domain-containing protein n=1 Tax=Urochloa decumbens TaxID=240449 RepID=A0ABC9C186_9POAL
MAGVEEEGEVVALREALRQQARVAEDLQAALEAEREAAASGADEALATIQRLQAEKAAERREADHFRRVAEMRIRHGEGAIASLRAVVVHNKMEIISLKSLNRMLLAAHAAGGAPFPLATTDHLPWLRRKLAKANDGVAPRRNASLAPAAHLEEFSSEPDVFAVDDRKPFRMLSDIGEVIGRDNWAARHNQSAPPKLSHRLRRAPSHARQQSLHEGHGSSSVLLEKATREGGRSSSSKEQSYQPQGELLLMSHPIEEVCGHTFSATIVRPLVKVAASMSLLRCLLIFILAVALAITKVLMSS